MTGSKSFYDVVVVGGSIGALVAGALLARRGFRVAWIRHDERSNAYTVAGATLLRASATLPFIDTPAFRRIASELALMPVMRRHVSVPDPMFQIVLPTHRIDVRPRADALIQELSREFGEVRRAMEDFYALVARAMAELDALFAADVIWPPSGFLERREASRAIASLASLRASDVRDPLADFPAEHPFRTFVHAQTRFAAAYDPDPLHPLRLVRAHGSAIRSAVSLEGGRDALTRLLEEKIAQYGGDLRPRDRVARIVVERGAVRGVDLATTDERLGCSFLLTSADYAQALRLADHTPSRVAYDRLLGRTPRYYRYVLNIVANAEGIPPGMGPRVFSVVDRARPLAEENLLSIETAPSDAKGRAVMTVTTLLPRSGVVEGEPYLGQQRARVLGALASVVPFLARHLVLTHSPHDWRPVEGPSGEPLAFADGPRRLEPEPMTALEDIDDNSHLGVCGIPARGDVRGLLLLGQQVVPGLGEEGELLAALSAARIVTRSDRTKEKLRRELWSKATT